MERTASRLAFIALASLLSACADGEDNGVDDSTTGPDLGSGSSTSSGEPPATSASASGSSTMSSSTAGPSESSGDTMPETGDSGSESGEPMDLDCDAYCSIYMDACQDFSEYANAQHCLDHCAQWPVGEPADTMHDSLGCRTYHVTVASTTDPTLHCPHSGPSGDHTCIAEDAPTCDVYCSRYFTNCTDDLNQWASMDECMTECDLWYPGTTGDTEGHTVGCRAYWANLAKGDPELNCGNAGPGGGDVCVLGLGG
jgi:hypothetical protein